MIQDGDLFRRIAEHQARLRADAQRERLRGARSRLSWRTDLAAWLRMTADRLETHASQTSRA